MLAANTRLTELRDLIHAHDYYYYALSAPQVTDQEYDSLYRELVELEREHPELFDANSPTQRVGAIGSGGFIKTKHERRMLSLQNTYSAEEVLEFLGAGQQVVMEPKIDGLSLKLIYERGRLKRAITRGNGEIGDDVTANARTVATVPLVLADAIDLEVTGEVYMRFSVFNHLNEELEADGLNVFANARNAAGGTLKLKNPAEVRSRRLSFAAHGCNTEFKEIETYLQMLALLDGHGFITAFMRPVADCFVLENESQVRSIIKKADACRTCLDFATDGLVFKLNSLSQQRELGEGTKFPKWAAAFKFPPERKRTTLLSVTLQIGKSGKVTPVAELKPLSLGGSVVKRASLCNQDEIDRLGVNAGDEVLVEKSAEIIPKVTGIAQKITAGAYRMSSVCPCCQTKLVKPEGRVDFFCPNRDCEEQVFARLRHATGKAALDIDGCGEAMVRELMEHGVRKLSDLFALECLDFLKPAARQRLTEGREAAKRQTFWRQLHALGIDDIGEATCRDIAVRWSSLASLNKEPNSDALRQLLGNAAWANFIDYMAREKSELDRLKECGLVFETPEENIGKLTGKVFAITGTLMSGGRNQVISRIEAAGGMVKSSVSKKCHYLIEGTDAGNIKPGKAKALGVPVIDEEELYVMLGQPMPVAVPAIEEREY